MVVDLFDDSDRFLLKQFSPITIVYITCFAAKAELTNSMVLRPNGHNFRFPHLNQNFQENPSLTDLF